MKKKILLVLLLILALSMTMLMTSCGGSSDEPAAAPEETAETETAEEPAAAQTLEDFAKTSSEMQSQLGFNEEAGVTVSVEGNDLIYNYDYSLNKEYSKDDIMSEDVKANLETYLEGEDAISQFSGNTVSVLESESGISGVRVVVIFSYGDDVIVTRTYDINGIVQE